MTKRELIDEIMNFNRTAEPEFLARFDDADLDEYLQHLRSLSRQVLVGDSSRYARYFDTHAEADARTAASTAVLDTPPEPSVEPWRDEDVTAHEESMTHRKLQRAISRIDALDEEKPSWLF